MTQEHKTYASLDAALAAHRVPVDNRELIRRFTAAIGITAYHDRGGYIRADRQDGKPALNINYGWTNGFADLDEARRACGDAAEVWTSDRARGMAGVTHPVNATREGSRRKASVERPETFCPTCFTALPATGVCTMCE